MGESLSHISDPYPIRPFAGPIHAVVTVPGSKSITNRALLCAALAEGTTRLEGVLFAEDTEAMLDCIVGLGAGVGIDRDACTVEITGTSGRVDGSDSPLRVRQSGTTARFVSAVMMLSGTDRLVDADPQMRARPMGPTFEALRTLGATVSDEANPGFLPARIRGSIHDHRPTIVLSADLSSQFISGLLLAAPCLTHGLRIELSTAAVSAPYLAMTIAVMESFGAVVTCPQPGVFIVEPGGYHAASSYRIEPDASAASYFFAAAAICGGSVRIDGLGSTSIQGDLGFVGALSAMGAHVHQDPSSTTVEGSHLVGVDLDFSSISDTAQTMAAVAVHAEGPTRIRGIGFIRSKETDRIAAVVAELRRCGVRAIEHEDGFEIFPGSVRPTRIETYDDHRMAMSFSLLGLRSSGIEIADPGCVSKTFPGFFGVLESLRPEHS
jgi:3-phosphoshikimate 1-carboxyvinyltransferase